MVFCGPGLGGTGAKKGWSLKEREALNEELGTQGRGLRRQARPKDSSVEGDTQGLEEKVCPASEELETRRSGKKHKWQHEALVRRRVSQTRLERK